MKHNEYTIVIHAPWDKGQCQYHTGPTQFCANNGSWAIRIVDDRDYILEKYSNICEAHLIQFVITWMVKH